MKINGSKPYVRCQYDLRIISNVNQRLQGLCSFAIRSLQYLKYKPVATNPMFVPKTMSAVFPSYIGDYKPCARSQYDFCNISYINLCLRTL